MNRTNLTPGNTWKSWGKAYGYNPEAHGFLESLGFVDASYGNDAAPSFYNERLGLRLWIDAIDPEDRECEGPRLALVETDGEGEFLREVIATDSWSEMAAVLRRSAL